MKNYQLLKDLVPKHKHSKNGFDRSSRDLFSMKAGMLLPVNCVETVPDGYYEIDIAALARTLPMVSAPYTQMKLYFDSFFVPYSQLWHGWDTWRAQRENYDTAYHRGYDYLPGFKLEDFWYHIRECLAGEGGAANYPYNEFGVNVFRDCVRIFGLLGYGAPLGTLTESKVSTMITNCRGKYATLWRIGAYQKIFQDHYMNPYFQLPNPYFYNFDDIPCDTAERSLLNTDTGLTIDVPEGSLPQTPRNAAGWSSVYMFIPRYRRWKQDLLMGLLPNAQFGEVSMMPGTDFTLNVLNDDIPANSPILKKDAAGNVIFGNNTNTTPAVGDYIARFSVDNLISVLDERRAKALQKWKETTMRAGFRARAQAIAHDGVAPIHSNDNRVVFLGSSSQIIGIDEVVAQAETGTGAGQSLGDIAGKGIATMNGSKIRYEATEFGIIMTLASIEPMSLYPDTGISPFNTKFEHFDYYTEEFESLGFAPVPENYLRGFVQEESILGYAPRYWEYKTNVDRVHGEFGSDGSLAAWTITRNDIVGGAGTTGPIAIRDFYINPKVVDSIFGVNSDDTQMTDQFWLTTVFDVKAVQPMSVLGLPY